MGFTSYRASLYAIAACVFCIGCDESPPQPAAEANAPSGSYRVEDDGVSLTLDEGRITARIEPQRGFARVEIDGQSTTVLLHDAVAGVVRTAPSQSLEDSVAQTLPCEASPAWLEFDDEAARCEAGASTTVEFDRGAIERIALGPQQSIVDIDGHHFEIVHTTTTVRVLLDGQALPAAGKSDEQWLPSALPACPDWCFAAWQCWLCGSASCNDPGLCY